MLWNSITYFSELRRSGFFGKWWIQDEVQLWKLVVKSKLR